MIPRLVMVAAVAAVCAAFVALAVLAGRHDQPYLVETSTPDIVASLQAPQEAQLHWYLHAKQDEHVRAQAASRAVVLRRARSAPIRGPVNGPGQVNGYPCGGTGPGSLPPCSVLRRESGGDPRIWNGRCYAPVGWRGRVAPNCPRARSSASGLFQFLRSTWARFGGYLNAADAPPAVQVEKARLTWADGRGCAHWSAC